MHTKCTKLKMHYTGGMDCGFPSKVSLAQKKMIIVHNGPHPPRRSLEGAEHFQAGRSKMHRYGMIALRHPKKGKSTSESVKKDLDINLPS